MTRKNASQHKPRPDFPLTPHPSDRWRKIHKGRPYWFGPLDDPDGAEARYKHAWPYITLGQVVPPMPGEVIDDDQIDFTTLRDAINLFLEYKEEQRGGGEISDAMFLDYKRTLRMVLEAVDPNRSIESIDTNDFAAIRRHLGDGRALQTLANHVTRARSMFKFCIDDGIRVAPLNYGVRFSKPKARTIKHSKLDKPETIFTAAECHRILDAVTQPLRAMVLLSLNTSMGNKELADLDRKHIKGNMLVVSRRKTAVGRRCVLWPETIEALEEAAQVRGRPKPDIKDAVFVTKYGNRWYASGMTGKSDPIGQAFTRVLDGLDLRVEGRGFYGLRHTHRTVTDSLPDRAACDLVMAHDDLTDMRGKYVRPQSISKARLKVVADHLHAWLFGDDGE